MAGPTRRRTRTAFPADPRLRSRAPARTSIAKEYSNQVQFFKVGQLGPFLSTVNVMYCPKDIATRQLRQVQGLVARTSGEGDLLLLERHRRWLSGE
jgi:hypothetical protein